MTRRAAPWLALALLAPLPSAAGEAGPPPLPIGAPFSVTATLAETVALRVEAAPDRLLLDSRGSNVNVLALLSGDGFGRRDGRLLWAPLAVDASAAVVVVGAAPGLVWSDGRPADASDGEASFPTRCGPDAPAVPVAARVRADGGEVAVLAGAAWDRAKVPDGRLGDEPADLDRAKDVTVDLCGHAFAPTALDPGRPTEAALVLAESFPWSADGSKAAYAFLGVPAAPAARSWGPHDFLDGTPDDPPRLP